MKYQIKELAELSGVSPRTLRYYDEIGLLCPERDAENDYRIYKEEQVDRLQQILFYRQLGLGLEEIRRVIDDPSYSREESLRSHLSTLKQQKEQLEILIHTVEQSLRAVKGEIIMSDKEKFEGFKQELIRNNEKQYGEEVIKKYGKEALEESNRKLSGMTEEQWQKQEQLAAEIITYLKQAMEQQDPGSEAAQKAADLHRQWLCMFWKEGLYSKETHRGMAKMYAADERFKAYYEERAGAGATDMLKAAIDIYTK